MSGTNYENECKIDNPDVAFSVLFLGGHPSITPKHVENVKVVVSGAAPIGNLDAERLIQK